MQEAPPPIQYPPPPGYGFILAGPGAGTLQRIPPPSAELSSFFPPGTDVNLVLNAGFSELIPHDIGLRTSHDNGHARPRPSIVPSASTLLRDRAATEAEAILREVTAGDALQSEECAICLQDFDDDAQETLRAMPSCHHAFHRHCISQWIRRNASCPVCRRNLHDEGHQIVVTIPSE